MTAAHQDLIDTLQNKYDSALRAVATYDQDDYTLRYADEGVSEEYSPSDIDSIYEDLVIQDINHGFQEQLFTDLGEVRGKFRLFKQGTVAHFWPTDSDEGLFVAFDETADPGPRTLLSIAEEYYA
jgi:hypothetical protein